MQDQICSIRKHHPVLKKCFLQCGIVEKWQTYQGKGCPNKNAGFNKVKKLFYFHEIAYIFTSLHVPI
jgi:hypothetical protein